MNPNLSNISSENGVYRFTLSGLNVSISNAIRRTILSDIPINVIRTETEDVNQCVIHTNTGRLHNEIIKHRLSCIPVHMKDLNFLPGKYELEIRIKNDTENMMFVTTEQFKLKNKENGEYLPMEETRKIFPPNEKTNAYIDFARLRPKMSEELQGEQLHLTAEFSISTAKVNSMFNVVSKCSYGNTIDRVKSAAFWEEKRGVLLKDGLSTSELAFQKKNYDLLDAQRIYLDDSFDFVIQSIGIYENEEIVYKSCAILQNKIIDIIQFIDSDIIQIITSETTIDHCFDIILQDEDYTIGKVLEYILYEKHYKGDKSLTFCGFKKLHPHNTDSRIRIAFDKKADKTNVKQILRSACIEAEELFKNIYKLFK